MLNPLTWGRLEWYYFIEDKYGDAEGIVECLSNWACAGGTPDDVKAIGIVCIIIIALLVGHRGAEIFKDRPRRKK
jgi:hypothetical protein